MGGYQRLPGAFGDSLWKRGVLRIGGEIKGNEDHLVRSLPQIRERMAGMGCKEDKIAAAQGNLLVAGCDQMTGEIIEGVGVFPLALNVTVDEIWMDG
jgi:hypothetical protein